MYSGAGVQLASAVVDSRLDGASVVGATHEVGCADKLPVFCHRSGGTSVLGVRRVCGVSRKVEVARRRVGDVAERGVVYGVGCTFKFGPHLVGVLAPDATSVCGRKGKVEIARPRLGELLTLSAVGTSWRSSVLGLLLATIFRRVSSVLEFKF